MDIKRSGTQQAGVGRAEWFTGQVRYEPLFELAEPGRAQGALVTFEPGARTAWHTHPFGQSLYVVAGSGRVQTWGGPVQDIQPGDVVTIAAGEKHWHGAAPDAVLTHIAVHEQQDGVAANWLEHVSDGQYAGAD